MGELGLFYRLSGYAAGVAVLLIAVAILVQVVGRLFGINLFGLVEVATYSMVAATFLALPYTLRTRGHIRIALLIAKLQGQPRRGVEVACYAIGFAFAAYYAFYCADLTVASFVKGARSQGMLSAPLWVPQSLMTLGIVAFALALLHGLVEVLRGKVDLRQEDSEAL